MSEAPVEPGEVLSGRFRVERVLGVGGMGVVVEATHLQLQQRIALKFLLPHMVASEEALQRFLREARAAATIRSEHVVRVSDVGTLDDGAPYMVMEFLEGRDLSERLQEAGRLDVVEAAETVMQALEAIAEAHAANIVHRDLKPANIFLAHRRDGSSLVKVLDFGISKPLDDSSLELTRTTAIMGSPLYMSPEQMRSSRDADQRSDIWSIGVILYELVSGETPFQAESLGGLAMAIGVEPPRPLRQICPEVPEGMVELIERCLAKDPAQRFQNVAELAQALRPFTKSRGAHISVERISSVMGEAAPVSSRVAPIEVKKAPALGQTNAGWGQTASGSDGHPTWVFGAAAAGALIAVGVGVALFTGHSGAAEKTATAAVAAEPSVEAPALPPPVEAEPEKPEPKVEPATEAPTPEPTIAASASAAPEATAAPAPTQTQPAPAVAAPRVVQAPQVVPVKTTPKSTTSKKKSSFSAFTRE